MEVPHCVVVLNGMAFETILSRGNSLLIRTFTKRLIYIFCDINMVIICINCLYIIFWNQNVSNGHSVTVHNCIPYLFGYKTGVLPLQNDYK